MLAVNEKAKRAAKGWMRPVSARRQSREARAAQRGQNPGDARPAPMSQEEALSPSAEVLPLVSDPDVLLAQAKEELHRVQNDILVDEQTRQERLLTLLWRVYVLSRDGQRNEERHRARLDRARVRVRADTPHHKQTVRILLAEAGIKVKKSTEHEWAKVVTALEHDEVAETESAVAQWLTEDALVNGEGCRGFDRAEATLRGSKKLKDAQRQKRQEAEAEERAPPLPLPLRTALPWATSSRLTARHARPASGFLSTGMATY
jgi:hypothetical protein